MLAQACSVSERAPAAASGPTAPLIVGFDGSTSAIAAVSWAAASGAPIILVRVLAPPPAGVDRSPTEHVVIPPQAGARLLHENGGRNRCGRGVS